MKKRASIEGMIHLPGGTFTMGLGFLADGAPTPLA
jgi:hypothetical protein